MKRTLTLAIVALAGVGGGTGCLSNLPTHGGGGGAGGTGGGGSGGPGMQVTCPNGGTTSLTGKVFAPNGSLPLYNAIVYVPGEAPAAFTDGVTCDRCNGTVSGNPVAIAQTGADGSFNLTNVPVGNNIPLIVQMGKWRRHITIPTVPQCVATALPAQMTTLPGKRSEGDMPKMAIASGSADPFECLLLKIGVDSSEITTPSGNGRIHFFLGETKPGTRMAGAPSEGDATAGLFTNLQRMLGYDVVMLPCEGTNNYQNTTAAQRSLLTQYLDAGGRVFSTHYSYQWLTYQASPYNVVGNPWNVDQAQPCGNNTTCGYIAALDTSFPKGQSFSSWLSNVSPGVNGSFEISDPRNDLDGVSAMYGQRWAYHQADSKIQHMTFNTPLNPPKDAMGNPQYCGRVVFSDFHVSANEATPGVPFPSACKLGNLTTQEKALAFMLFDLSSCVQADNQPPIP